MIENFRTGFLGLRFFYGRQSLILSDIIFFIGTQHIDLLVNENYNYKLHELKRLI